MKAFSDYKAEKAASRELLPAGGYIAKILNAEVATYTGQNGSYSKLIINFDIADGGHKDFFKSDYNDQTGEDKKWRGVFRLNIPQDDGSERDSWSKRSFGNAMWAIEASNSGYHWDWNEAGLKGKSVGVLFRDREWEMTNSKGEDISGWTTECCAFTDVQSIKDGTFKMPKKKPLKKESAAIPAASNEIHLTEEERDALPWEMN
jgi:hypothetical protein